MTKLKWKHTTGDLIRSTEIWTCQAGEIKKFVGNDGEQYVTYSFLDGCLKTASTFEGAKQYLEDAMYSDLEKKAALFGMILIPKDGDANAE